VQTYISLEDLAERLGIERSTEDHTHLDETTERAAFELSGYNYTLEETNIFIEAMTQAGWSVGGDAV
jgi:hypothetical protein